MLRHPRAGQIGWTCRFIGWEISHRQENMVGNNPFPLKSDMWEISQMDVALISRNLTQWLERTKLDAKTASKRAGLGETYVGDIIRGRSKSPRIAQLQKVADVLGCSTDDLISDEKHIQPENRPNIIEFTATPYSPIASDHSAFEIDPEVLRNLLNSPEDKKFFSLWVRMDDDTKLAVLEITEAITRLAARKPG